MAAAGINKRYCLGWRRWRRYRRNGYRGVTAEKAAAWRG